MKPSVRLFLVLAALVVLVMGIILVPPQVQRYEVTQVAINAIAHHDNIPREQIDIVEFRPAPTNPSSAWIIGYVHGYGSASTSQFLIRIDKTKSGYQVSFAAPK